MDNRRSPKCDRKNNDWMGTSRGEEDKQNPEFYMELHYLIHQQSPCGKTLKSLNVLWKLWCLLWTSLFVGNWCWMWVLLIAYGNPMPESLDGVEIFLDLRLEVEMFRNEKRKVVAELVMNVVLRFCIAVLYQSPLKYQSPRSKETICWHIWCSKGF